VYSVSDLLADLNFQSVSELYRNFTRMSPSEFEFLRKNLEKGHSAQESHFCSRKFGTDAAFLGKW
jgi:predicted phosphoribosyltransferase